ncbi:MAG: hypothetical protein PF689_10720 [Deltaproteobacteria bacterium]|jgi:hypothetical protein|nr:hypothetical protein [Deltaproteobacteria bacterium]
MIVCTNCYTQVSDEFREKSELCPFCYNILPEPEPEPEPEIVEPQDGIGTAGIGAEGALESAIEDPRFQKKSNKGVIIGSIAAVIALLAIGSYMFMGGDSSEDEKKGGGKKGLDPKLVASLKSLDTKIQDRISGFFQKTCKSFQQTGYAFKTQLMFDDKEKYTSSIMPGDGSATDNTDWFKCPVKLADIRSKSDMKIKLEAIYVPPPDLFSKSTRYLKVFLEGKNVKEFEGIELSKRHYMNTWDFGESKKTGKEFLHVSVGRLYKAPKVLKSINGYHEASHTGSKKNRKYFFTIKGVKFSQTKQKRSEFGTFEGQVKGWFGTTFTNYIKDWGTGCVNDINISFKNIKQKMIKAHDDLELFQDNPHVTKYMELAEEGGKLLCATMPKAHKIIKLYDENKPDEAKELSKKMDKELQEAKKALQDKLQAHIQKLEEKLNQSK